MRRKHSNKPVCLNCKIRKNWREIVCHFCRFGRTSVVNLAKGFGAPNLNLTEHSTIACEQALLFGRLKRVSRERASERRKESLQPSLANFHLYFAQTKGNTIGWKMTFRKSKLIDNRLSWHPLRLCGSQRDQIGTENLFQPSKQTSLHSRR